MNKSNGNAKAEGKVPKAEGKTSDPRTSRVHRARLDKAKAMEQAVPREPLVVLSGEERKAVQTYEATITLALELMKRGQQAHWAAIIAKYGLPSEFDYRPETGEIF